MTNPDAPIAVIGGGLAGLAAALDLAEAGLPTLLIERRPFVGGKAFSFRDPQHGVELDNGQHITMRCCTALQALMERVGCDDIVRYQPGLRVPVIDPANSADGVNPLSADLAASRPRLLRWLTWSPSPIPAPLHLASSVLAYPHLSLIERLNLGRALLPMRRMSESQRRGLDRTSFGAWLRQQGQSDRAVERFWDLIILPTCNDRCDRVSAAQAMQVFRDGFLFDSRAGDIGLFRRGLGEVAQAALTRFRDLGGRTLLGRAIDSLEISSGDAVGVRFSLGDPIPIRGAILALPPHRALELLPDAWRKREPFWRLAQHQTQAIVNIQLHWDRPVFDDDFAAVLDPDVQFVFNRSRLQSWDGPGQWLSVSISGARDLLAASNDDIAARAADGLRRALPAARDAELIAARVIREAEATFRPLPGIAAHRVGPRTAVPNLALAGAWTDTRWPATMESAVRSGHAAADLWTQPKNES